MQRQQGDGTYSHFAPRPLMSRLAYCCCIAVIACGIELFHMARANVNTPQINAGCEVLHRVYRPARRSHMLKICICVHNSEMNSPHCPPGRLIIPAAKVAAACASSRGYWAVSIGLHMRHMQQNVFLSLAPPRAVATVVSLPLFARHEDEQRGDHLFSPLTLPF